VPLPADPATTPAVSLERTETAATDAPPVSPKSASDSQQVDEKTVQPAKKSTRKTSTTSSSKKSPGGRKTGGRRGIRLKTDLTDDDIPNGPTNKTDDSDKSGKDEN
jgi:hypothetical protein